MTQGPVNCSPGASCPGEKKTTTFSSLLKTFAENTTMHGLRNTFDTKKRSNCWRWRNAVWLLVMVAASAWAWRNLVVVIEAYFKYPVSTTIRHEEPFFVEFPAVTMCNLNKMPFDKLNRFRTKSNLNNTLLAKTIDTLVERLSQRERVTTGHNITEMLKICTFGHAVCTSSDFRTFYNQKYGTCYTFNVGAKSRFAYTPGPNNGLSVVLDVQEDRYTSTTEAVGVKVVVHPVQTVPFPEDEGILASTGFLTSIGLSKMDINRPGLPHSDCIGTSEYKTFDFYSNRYIFSFQWCEKSCYQVITLDQCQCCNPKYPCLNIPLEETYGYDLSSLPAQKVNCNESQQTCLNDLELRFQSGSLECKSHCLKECHQQVYDTKVSTAQWPSPKFVAQNPNLLSILRNLSYSQRSLLKLEVFFQSLRTETISMNPTYDWSQLLSDVGGTVGLWLGFSIMTGIEVLELILDCALLAFSKLSHKRNQEKTAKVASSEG